MSQHVLQIRCLTTVGAVGASQAAQTDAEHSSRATQLQPLVNRFKVCGPPGTRALNDTPRSRGFRAGKSGLVA